MISRNLKKRINTSLALLFLIYLIFTFQILLVFTLLIFSVLSIIEFLNLTKKIFKNNFYITITNIFFITYIFTFSLIFFYFSQFLQLKIILFVFLFGCIASDIGGLILGKLFKGPKLTKLSPNKTISGAVGSIVLTTIVLSIFYFYFTNNFSYLVLILGIFTSMFCQLGDLFFSFLKRKAKVKDTGNFLPGHGGILDRLDGILLGIPLSFFAFSILY
jgi:phosphatidate cytidylyltransferase